MNSIEALISLIAITLSISILINTIIIEEKEFQKTAEMITAKTNSLKCAFIIDSLISNSTKQYSQELNCSANENQVSSKINNETKNTPILTKAKNTPKLEIEYFEHYK